MIHNFLNTQLNKELYFCPKAFGTSAEALDHFLTRGIINWGTPVKNILEDGMLFIQQAKAPESSGLVTILLEGKQGH